MYSILALIAAATAAETYGLIIAASGSDVHLKPIKLASNNQLSANGETDITLTIGDDGAATISPGGNLNLYQGRLTVDQSVSSSPGVWAVTDGHLTFDGSNSFVVCRNDNYDVYFSGQGQPSGCEDSVGISIIAASSGGAESSGASEAASSASETSSEAAASSEAPATTESAPASTTEAAGSTEIVSEVVTETVCTHETCTGVHSANGAGSNGVALGAFAAAALALF